MNAHATAIPWRSGYDALFARAAVLDLGARTLIELTGADRATFLHNLCTNEIRKLPLGGGCEAFLTSVQGKTLAHVLVYAQPEALVIDTVAGQAEKILQHLDHYLVCEQVSLSDRSRQWSNLLLAGPDAGSILTELGNGPPPEARLGNSTISISGQSVWLRRADLIGTDCFLLSVADDQAAALRAVLLERGAAACDAGAVEAARIEHGFPLFGRDITDSNLPQEVGRDAQAISFVKGCYLGQETVARIDALGHVNKTLVGIRIAGGEIPVPGAELLSQGQVVGHVTSAAFSPFLDGPLALGYVRRGSNTPGSRLLCGGHEASVMALPVR